jgi:peptide/nickel transport system permease protein
MQVNQSVSPSQLIWRRLRKNAAAMTGLTIVAVAVVISVFCYLFIPDNTPDANEMNLPLSTLPPGTSVTVLSVPMRSEIVQPGLLQRMLTGTPSGFVNIAIDSLWIVGDTAFYREYSGDPESLFPVEKKHFGELFAGSSDFEMTRGKLVWADAAGNMQQIQSDDAKNDLLNKRIETRTYYLGTDRFGRDLLSRILAGTRVSISVGLIAVIISLVIGITFGALAGFFRGWVDDVIMWLINVIWSIPTLLLVIAITLALGKGFAQVFIAVGLTMWVEVARVVRGQIFSLREMEFVEAGRALGFSNSRIILRHILPNIVSPVIVIAASNFASAILLEAGLSFLGMGAQPPTPSWGMMIKENYGYIIVDAAYLAVYRGLAIMIMVLAFTWLGNGLRDAVDAKEGSGSKA